MLQGKLTTKNLQHWVILSLNWKRNSRLKRDVLRSKRTTEFCWKGWQKFLPVLKANELALTSKIRRDECPLSCKDLLTFTRTWSKTARRVHPSRLILVVVCKLKGGSWKRTKGCSIGFKNKIPTIMFTTGNLTESSPLSELRQFVTILPQCSRKRADGEVERDQRLLVCLPRSLKNLIESFLMLIRKVCGNHLN